VFVVALLLSLVPILGLTHLTGASTIAIFSLTSLIFITFNARMIPAMALVTATVNPAQRGSFMSLNSATQSIGAGLAAYTAGTIISKDPAGTILHYEWVGYLAAAVSLFALFMIGRIRTVEE
jgi:predicted MFS family arabinose efflux permease